MRVLVTGSGGFVGKNLVSRLTEQKHEVLHFTRDTAQEALPALVAQAEAIIHLAGENRPQDEAAFELVNGGLTQLLCDAVQASGRPVPLILASSAQAALDNPYGRSKLSGERAVAELAAATGSSVLVYRLPGVFGKWCRPHYNSVVATFCHNVARGLPIQIADPDKELSLVYVDDLIDEFMRAISAMQPGLACGEVAPVYTITLGALAAQIEAFRESRSTLVTERVGCGMTRALYSTYVSFLPPEHFAYEIPRYGDQRGVFVEMLKTPDSGQFSFFTAHPGVTRGEHYHHSKTEKFLVIKGSARFGFRNLVSGERTEVNVEGEELRIVDTIPGWVHDITNVGTGEMIVLLWANEIFDRQRPDTIAGKV
jgi:UDP-2-acetamido-2,6-beta-L-arabino-hexul-4-ose reductase